MTESSSNIIHREVIYPFSVANENECHIERSLSPIVQSEAEFDLNSDDSMGLEALFSELNDYSHPKIIESLSSKVENTTGDYDNDDSDDDFRGLEPLFSEYPPITDKYTGKLMKKTKNHGYKLSNFFFKKTAKIGGKVVLIDNLDRIRGDVFIDPYMTHTLHLFDQIL